MRTKIICRNFELFHFEVSFYKMRIAKIVIGNKFSWQNLKRLAFRYRNPLFLCAFFSMLILLFWSTALTQKAALEKPFNLLAEFNQSDVAGGVNWKRAKVDSLAELDMMAVKEKNERLPDYYFEDPDNRTSYQTYKNSKMCAPYPKYTDLIFTNQYWQVLDTFSSGKYLNTL